MAFNASPGYSQQAGYQPKIKIPGYTARQLPNLTPQQNQLLEQLIGSIGPGAQQAGDYFSKLGAGDEDQFEEMERPYQNAYNKFLGSTARRFSHLGARNSSSFRNAAISGAQELSEQIGSKRQGLQQNALSLLLNQANSLLSQRPFENVVKEKPQGASGQFGDILGQSIPILLKGLLGA